MAQRVKIQIKSIFGKVLFEYEKENNTIRDTVEEAVRRQVSLRYANLRYANLGYTNLSFADLSFADLSNTSLCYASFNSANLSNADLSNASLYNASLRYAFLFKTNLSNAYLRDTDLGCVSLDVAENIPYIPLRCPSDGAFIGWKQVDGKLVQLLIPEDAKRSSSATNCRCDKAKVLAITSLDGAEQYDSVLNTTYTTTDYKVGEMVYPDKFDDDRWNDFGGGIYFFIDKQDAINY